MKPEDIDEMVQDMAILHWQRRNKKKLEELRAFASGSYRKAVIYWSRLRAQRPRTAPGGNYR